MSTAMKVTRDAIDVANRHGNIFGALCYTKKTRGHPVFETFVWGFVPPAWETQLTLSFRTRPVRP